MTYGDGGEMHLCLPLATPLAAAAAVSKAVTSEATWVLKYIPK